ncbi:MAG: hypothetical protein DME99_04850 [Verrucomicrobia bacterium]|nr:MAG: hypothetical protein DME99_04850 [Verrucomicrobiota bacterium]
MRIAAGGELGRIERCRRERFDFLGEKRRCKVAQLLDRRAAISSKFTQLLKINNPPRLGRPIRLRRSEFVEGLSSFFVNGKPVIRSWFWDRLNSGASVENVRRRTGDNPPRSPTAAPLTSGRGG